MSLTICPICSSICRDHVSNSPYWRCDNCSCWFQDPAPPKIWHAEHEKQWREGGMPDSHKAANDSLAEWLFVHVMKGQPGATLDVGADYPYLASRLAAKGCDASALDADCDGEDKLGVKVFECDFDKPSWTFGNFEKWPKQSLITFVHSFEHLYRPVEAFHRLRQLVTEDGHLFIRMPDHSVEGYERDMTAGHYQIHPFFHTLNSILQCLVESAGFVVQESIELKPGQRDMVMRPI